MPDHLGPEAKKEWKRIAPQLVELGLLTPLDMAALALYCSAWGQVRMLETALAAEMKKMIAAGRQPAEALTETSDRSGLSRISTLQLLLTRARAEADRYLAAFGLTPAARCRLTASRAVEPQRGGERGNGFDEL